MALEGFADQTKALIAAVGKTITIRDYVKSGLNYDPTLTPSDTSATGAQFDYTAAETDGSIIKAGDVLYLISTTFTVTEDSKIVDGSDEYTIVRLEKVGPGDESFYYRAQCRI